MHCTRVLPKSHTSLYNFSHLFTQTHSTYIYICIHAQIHIFQVSPLINNSHPSTEGYSYLLNVQDPNTCTNVPNRIANTFHMFYHRYGQINRLWLIKDTKISKNTLYALNSPKYLVPTPHRLHQNPKQHLTLMPPTNWSKANNSIHIKYHR